MNIQTERVKIFIQKLREGDLSIGLSSHKMTEIAEKIQISPQLLNKSVNGTRKVKPYELQGFVKEFGMNPDFASGRSEEMFQEGYFSNGNSEYPFITKSNEDKHRLMNEFLDKISPQIKGTFSLEPGVEYNPDSMKVARIVFKINID
ncbi:HTH_XRE domain containing protein [uncultured Caudovirales phage]|uniref:HTH_XRE domain containing protein n=1 Tax=uncultured Caudovirales phage TaxID=2100421 RepID=A0A6J5SST1_9CAUD|nr:HTH_XRE domain containing protein [uncultured Caudovirales phage]